MKRERPHVTGCPCAAQGRGPLGQQAQTGAVDPLILALEDEDERVQARALELIEQDWMQAAEQ